MDLKLVIRCDLFRLKLRLDAGATGLPLSTQLSMMALSQEALNLFPDPIRRVFVAF